MRTLGTADILAVDVKRVISASCVHVSPGARVIYRLDLMTCLILLFKQTASLTLAVQAELSTGLVQTVGTLTYLERGF